MITTDKVNNFLLKESLENKNLPEETTVEKSQAKKGNFALKQRMFFESSIAIPSVFNKSVDELYNELIEYSEVAYYNPSYSREKAISMADEILKRDPNHIGAHGIKGLMHSVLNDRLAAIVELTIAIQNDPDCTYTDKAFDRGDFHYFRGIYYKIFFDDVEKAREDFQIASDHGHEGAKIYLEYVL